MTSQAGKQKAAGAGRAGEGGPRETEGREGAAAGPRPWWQPEPRASCRMKKEKSPKETGQSSLKLGRRGQNLGKSFFFSEPQFPSLGNGNVNTASQAC